MNIEKILKDNNIDMSVKEFKGYTKKVNKMYHVLVRLDMFIKNILKEVA